MESIEACRNELRNAYDELRSRCLHQAARWASEQLMGLPAEGDECYEVYVGASPQRALVPRTPEDAADADAYRLAVSHFEAREYTRATRVLEGARGPRAMFLKLYSTYLAGERRREEERLETSGPLGRPPSPNRELAAVESACVALISSQLEAGATEADPFLLYLWGLVLSDLQRQPEAATVLARSVSAFPGNWSAWHALSLVCSDADAAASLRLPQHWTREFFQAALHLESGQHAESLDRLQSASQLFPSSDTVLLQAATAQYNLRNYSEAQQLFEELSERDPDRIEGMDVYSNILYVHEAFGPLSELAHRMTAADKYRPETCCVVGNYYSLRNHHERAVLHFQRALRLSPGYLSAWTLMGHEYVEMKNPSAAIDCYRRAVDINPRDYRAWYGLGQTHELLMQPHYALYYFRRAAQLRPRDPRMWTALGQCYESARLGMYQEAIRCYRQAVAHNDPEGIAVQKLARLHEALGETDEAAHYHRRTLERLTRGAVGHGGAAPPLGTEGSEACLFLAQYCRDRGELAEAEVLCQRLLDVGGPAKDKAKSILRELRALMAQRGPRRSGDVGPVAGLTTPGGPARPATAGARTVGGPLQPSSAFALGTAARPQNVGAATPSLIGPPDPHRPSTSHGIQQLQQQPTTGLTPRLGTATAGAGAAGAPGAPRGAAAAGTPELTPAAQTGGSRGMQSTGGPRALQMGLGGPGTGGLPFGGVGSSLGFGGGGPGPGQGPGGASPGGADDMELGSGSDLDLSD